MRSQSFAQQRSVPFRPEGSQNERQTEDKRPRSSDANSDSPSGLERRVRSHHSAEPGEITSSKSEKDAYPSRRSVDQDMKPGGASTETTARPGPSPNLTAATRQDERKDGARKKKGPNVRVVKFSLPPKQAPEQQSESDDDEDMADYFAMEIEKTEAELSKLEAPRLPMEVVARFGAMSHGAMVKILNEREGLTEMVGPIPDDIEMEDEQAAGQLVASQRDGEIGSEAIPQDGTIAEGDRANDEVTGRPGLVSAASDLKPKKEEMELDQDGKTAALPRGPSNEALTAAEGRPNILSADDGRVFSLQPPGLQSETVEQGSKPPSTPSQIPDEEDDETESEDEGYLDTEAVRRYMSTPPLDTLPDFSGERWDKDADYLGALGTDAAVDSFIVDHLQKFHIEKSAEQTRDREIYSENYLNYLGFTRSSDPAAVKSRDKFSVAAPPPDPTGVVTPEPKPEGRGTGRRFATERDLERVLQASMREDEERKEREQRVQKEKYRSEKEAVIPDMSWTEEDLEEARYIDRTGYVSQDRLVSAWQVLPPINNFTQEEAELFEKKYLELPKQWGKVAEVIEKRDFGTCIQYYYLMKKNLNLKEKLKKQPKRRKKGGSRKQRSSALVSELGNGEPETEDNTETGENGERRRPRRAAAPTWGFEQPSLEPENGSSSAGTPGRRGASAARDKSDKIDGRKGRRKTAKDKDGKLPKPNQTLAAAPGPGSATGRSRPSSRLQNAEFPANMAPDAHRLPTQLEQPLAAGIQPPFAVQPHQAQQQPIQGLDRQPLGATSMSDVMVAPSLRPEPPPPPPQPAMSTFNLAQPQQDRKAPTQASSYWSVSESNDFPHLLRAFGSDWNAIAAHMGSKTAVMVCAHGEVQLSSTNVA